ncbi:Protein RTF2 homolog [Eumeta japonica]|uniref:Replication termination factor 2 n=1 Tax=Eumeta variegata TaxID=151549 RepID=A0A4C1WTQ6_EUMVA|nr:Protein RTF2 homolog [Eumeta japonica]
MGCDGGTIPKRDELVRMKKKPEQKDKDAERTCKWRNCALSQQPLQEPIVACGLGKLYSKSSVLEALLDKESKPDSINHIKNMKDIKDLKLVKNPAYADIEHNNGAVDEGSAPYICPISGLEMTGRFRFVFLWSCGCVLAERALKEVKQNICHMCQQPFKDEDIVVLNGTEEDLEQLKNKIAVRNANRKNKKIKKEKPDTDLEKPSTSKCELNNEMCSDSSIKKEAEAGPSHSTKKEMDTIPLSLPKYDEKKQMRGLLGSFKRAPPNDFNDDPIFKKTKKDYSVAKDPKSSEIYKSIFTSHQTEKQQQRAHWVTYNPFYN